MPGLVLEYPTTVTSAIVLGPEPEPPAPATNSYGTLLERNDDAWTSVNFKKVASFTITKEQVVSFLTSTTDLLTEDVTVRDGLLDAIVLQLEGSYAEVLAAYKVTHPRATSVSYDLGVGWKTAFNSALSVASIVDDSVIGESFSLIFTVVSGSSFSKTVGVRFNVAEAPSLAVA
jgi:hypothetical protein